MEQRSIQTVRFGDEEVQIQTTFIHGIDCLRLEDVQQQFPTVTALSIDGVQQTFVADEHGNNLKPLRIEACKDKIIDAKAPQKSSNSNLEKKVDDLLRNSEEMKVTTGDTAVKVDQVIAKTRQILDNTRHLMTQIYELHEYTTPRYFFILPVKNHDWAMVNTFQSWYQMRYKLYFLCECSDDPKELHVAPHDGYPIKKFREFITKYGPYLRETIRAVQVLLTLGGLISPQLGHASATIGKHIPLPFRSSAELEKTKKKVKFIEDFLEKKVDTKLARAEDSIHKQAKHAQGAPLQGAELRELISYLDIVDSKRRLGNLYRTVISDGHVRWVCLEHYDAISFNNKLAGFASQLEAMGGEYDAKNKEAVLTSVKLEKKKVNTLSDMLSKGFTITKLIFDKCAISQGDFDTLFGIFTTRSSIHYFEVISLTVYTAPFSGRQNYLCQYMKVSFQNQSLEVRFADHYQWGNTRLLSRLLLESKIHQALDLSASDFLGHEQDLKHCLEKNETFTSLIIHHANNIEILNAISTLKNNKFQRLKLNHSLGLSSVSFHFCKLLQENHTLVEIDLIDCMGFSDANFITDLFRTLRQHKSIKQLSLHICNVAPLNQMETSLIESLENDKFITHLCFSESIISQKLTQTLINAIQNHGLLDQLEFYKCQINDDDISQLQALDNNETLMHLIISEQPRSQLNLQETENECKKKQLLLPSIPINYKWKQNTFTYIGGHGNGKELNQFSYPCGIYIDDDQTILVADKDNHRIIQWKRGETNGQIVAGGNGEGKRNDQLRCPMNVIQDKETDSLIICDTKNRRIVRWPRQNDQNGETIISDVDCWDLAMDNDGYLYVSDFKKHEVKRWRIGETDGTVVAGGNGKGDKLNQLDHPYYIAVDDDQSIYVSDRANHRVMKWMKNAKEGIVVAGGQGPGNGLTQLSHPNGIIVDQLGTLYVANRDNKRVMRWLKGAKEGDIIIDENGSGNRPNQFGYPRMLAFDQENNLYVVDRDNHRVVKFDSDFS